MFRHNLTNCWSNFLNFMDCRWVLLRMDRGCGRLGNRIAGSADVAKNHGWIIHETADHNHPNTDKTFFHLQTQIAMDNPHALEVKSSQESESSDQEVDAKH
jgi:hypothetical protein